MSARPPELDAAFRGAAQAMAPTPRPTRIAPPSLRPTTLDPLQVDVFAAIIATLPAPPLRLVGDHADG